MIKKILLKNKKYLTKSIFGKKEITKKEYAKWCKKNCNNNPCTFFEMIQDGAKYNIRG